MRKLGLNALVLTAGLALAAALGCKAAPEPSPAEASAPTPSAPAAPPSAIAPEPTVAPTAPASAAPTGERTYAEATKNISAKVGERFAVALPANITIPMKWRLEPAPDPKLFRLVEEKHFDEPPPGCDGCTGYGGTRVFRFEANGAGKATLHFALKPLTNPSGKSEKDVTIEIVCAP